MKYSVSLDSKDWGFIWMSLATTYEGCYDDEALADDYEKSREIMRKLDLAKARAQKRAANKVDHSAAEAIIARKLGS